MAFCAFIPDTYQPTYLPADPTYAATLFFSSFASRSRFPTKIVLFPDWFSLYV